MWNCLPCVGRETKPGGCPTIGGGALMLTLACMKRGAGTNTGALI